MSLDYLENLSEIIEAGQFHLSTIKPSEWTEQNRYMDSSVSRYKGKFSYDITPYTKEIIDCLNPNHPARRVAVMKGAQIGFSVGVIESGIGWIISQNPGNILLLTGHADLSEEAIVKIDNMIDSCGIRNLIRSNISRARNMKTGDTNTKKEFPGGMLVAGSSNNHKLLRQRSVQYGFIDDFDAAKKTDKSSGSTAKMIEQRFAAYYDKMKLFYISTPELKQASNIEPQYLLGDQRKYHIPCPNCGELIVLNWSVEIDGTEGKEKGGITWKLDNNNKLIIGSVGYICQKCSGFFDDSNKHELNLAGRYIPTTEPSSPGYYSFHISSLYAPAGMYDWEHYVRQYLEANPIGKNQNENLYQTFVNLCLGETYEQKGKSPKANQLQKNIRNYPINFIPEKLSIKDGNGKIVLITCCCDLNGTVNDARLDYEIVGWSESGSSYSINQGSIGTFIPLEGQKKYKVDRERWTYEHHKSNSVWPEFDKILDTVFLTDTKRRMKIFITGVDTGHYTTLAYIYIDNTKRRFLIAIKGKDTEKFIKHGADLPTFKLAKERSNLYLAEVNNIKDDLADRIELRWDSGNDDQQPAGFMNFPTPSDGKYLYNNFFSHYESEHRITENKDGQGIASKWEKKNSIVQNHFFDVAVYNMVTRDILVYLVMKELKVKHYTWSDYVNAVMGKK